MPSTDHNAPGIDSGAPMVSLERVSFTYEGEKRPAVRDLSLSIPRGDLLGIIGPSGSGKTTLASILSGAVPHHFAGEFRGVCRVDGLDTCQVPLTDVSRRVGSVLQDIDAQMVAANVEDELLFGVENFGVAHDEIPDRVREALATCGILDLAHRDIATLSGGQKQKVAIAAILALRAPVMVLDEPTAALDPVSSRAVFDTLRELVTRQDMTVIVIEQKIALLSEYCDHLAVMDDGDVALHGTPREVLAHGDELRRIGVDSPRVTRVSNQFVARGLIGAPEVCLTVGEAEDLVSRVVGRDAADRPRPVAPLRAAQGPGGPGAASEAVLSLEHVSFTYPGNTASLVDVSLDVRPGELVCVIGQNGAGKTTATKLMNGLLKPSSGRVCITGLDTALTRTSEIARHVSTLFQDPDRQICKGSVVEEVAFSLELLGVPRDEALRRAADTVDHFSLPASAAPFSLGRGQRQIVALASVVVTNPQVLILDEPTSGLDYRECMVVMDAVSAARQQGCAVVMVCHDMEVVSDFATRLVVMADGRVIADGDVADVFADERVMRAASVRPPEIARLARRLSERVSPAYGRAREVADVVLVTEGLVA
ncbi:ABC transporter ATP-binding protein [Olsenella massiliensis]|uniref:ABC transporter ATP-binding protein n=1 Tax=Olsenella massiliensis TaxID=1622075 RepID=UPI000B1099C3